MNFYVVIAIIGWGIWAFTAKLSAEQIHPLWLQIVNYSIGFLCIPIFFALLKHTPNSNIATNNLLWPIISSICGLIAFVAYSFALKNGDAGTTTILCSTYPAITFLLSVLFLGETISFSKILGLITILFGAFLIIK